MIRLAEKQDLAEVTALYEAILDYEAEHVNYTNWKKGLYPTAASVEKAYDAGTLYIGVQDDGAICSAVNLNAVQPEGYDEVPWAVEADGAEVLVIHTLGVHPQRKGHGYAKEVVLFAEALAKEKGCKTIRLDTFEENAPAEHLYTNLGYTFRGKIRILFESVIWETLICMDKVL